MNGVIIDTSPEAIERAAISIENAGRDGAYWREAALIRALANERDGFRRAYNDIPAAKKADQGKHAHLATAEQRAINESRRADRLRATLERIIRLGDAADGSIKHFTDWESARKLIGLKAPWERGYIPMEIEE